MKPITLALLSLLACQAEAPLKPAKELDPQDPRSVLEHAVFRTRSQKSFETKFKAKLAVPNGAPLDYEGQCVWVGPAVLYVHYTASGGDVKNIVRAGEKAWVYHPLLGVWPTADEAGMAGAGRGIQNPDEVLAVVARHTETAKAVKPGLIELSFAGADIEKIMREQAQAGAFEWKESSARLEVGIDAEGRVSRFSCDATLKSTNPQVKGTVRYTGDVELVGYNAATELKFLDEKNREIKLPPEITTAVQSLLKEKK